MDDMIAAAIVLAEFMNLGMAVVAAGNTVAGTGRLDLVVFQAAEFQTSLLQARLQKPPAAAAAVIIGPVRVHLDKIFFSDNSFYDIPQIFGNWIAKSFANNLTWILNGKLYFQIFIPVGVNVQLALTDPLGIVFVNVFNFKIVGDIEFFQSCQD
jgi:hypothetical protein